MRCVFVQFRCIPGKTYRVADAIYDREVVSELYSTSGAISILIAKIYIPDDEDVGHYLSERAVRHSRHQPHPDHHDLQGLLSAPVWPRSPRTLRGQEAPVTHGRRWALDPQPRIHQACHCRGVDARRPCVRGAPIRARSAASSICARTALPRGLWPWPASTRAARQEYPPASPGACPAPWHTARAPGRKLRRIAAQRGGRVGAPGRARLTAPPRPARPARARHDVRELRDLDRKGRARPHRRPAWPRYRQKPGAARVCSRSTVRAQAHAQDR